MNTESNGPGSLARIVRPMTTGETITEDTEFEIDSGVWVMVGDAEDKSISSRWMIGSKYSPRLFVAARTTARPNAQAHPTAVGASATKERATNEQ